MSDAIVDQLAALGVAPGDTLMVHASMRRVGGRAQALIDALDRAVGPEGTLLMMTSPDDSDASFDYLTVPTDPDNGVLAEVFRTHPGTVSSDHPEGRFSARGALATTLISDVPWNDYYGPRSPLQRLLDAHGKVLRLGADIDTVTLLHYAEYLAKLPDKRTVTRHRRLKSGEVARITCLDDEHGIADWPGPDYFGLILGEYLSTGRPHFGMVGGAASELIDAADLVRFAVVWLEHTFG